MNFSESPDYMTYVITYAEGNFVSASKHIENMLESGNFGNPSQKAHLLQVQADICFRLGNLEKACSLHNQAEEIDCSLLTSYVYAKFLAYSIKDYQRAVKKCEQIVERAIAHPYNESEEDRSSDYYMHLAQALKSACIRATEAVVAGDSADK